MLEMNQFVKKTDYKNVFNKYYEPHQRWKKRQDYYQMCRTFGERYECYYDREEYTYEEKIRLRSIASEKAKHHLLLKWIKDGEPDPQPPEHLKHRIEEARKQIKKTFKNGISKKLVVKGKEKKAKKKVNATKKKKAK